MSTINYLDRMLDPMAEALTTDVARKILELKAAPDLLAQVDVFRHKANAGTLSPDEDANYKAFIEALDVVSLIQAKARRFLAAHSG